MPLLIKNICVCKCIHTYIHIHTYTYTYTYIHIHTHTYTYIYIHTHTYTYIHIHTHTYTYIHIHTHTYTYIHIHTHTQTYTHIHIHTPTYTYIYIHIHFSWKNTEAETRSNMKCVLRTIFYHLCAASLFWPATLLPLIMDMSLAEKWDKMWKQQIWPLDSVVHWIWPSRPPTPTFGHCAGEDVWPLLALEVSWVSWHVQNVRRRGVVEESKTSEPQCLESHLGLSLRFANCEQLDLMHWLRCQHNPCVNSGNGWNLEGLRNSIQPDLGIQ